MLSFRGRHGPLVEAATRLVQPYVDKDDVDKAQLAEVAGFLLTLPSFDRDTIQRAFSAPPQRSRQATLFSNYRQFIDVLLTPKHGVLFNKLQELWTIQECATLVDELKPPRSRYRV